MINAFRHLLFFFAAMVFTGCGRELDIDLPVTDSKIIVESYLASGDSLWVRVDESASYYDDGNATDRGRNANVEITFNGNKYSLIEHDGVAGIRVDSATRLLKPTFYFLPKSIVSIPETGTISLEVNKEGRSVRAFSTIPDKVKIEDFMPLFRANQDSLTLFDAEVSASFPTGTSYYVVQERQVVTRNDTVYWDVIVLHELIAISGTGNSQTITIRSNTVRSYTTAAQGFQTLYLLRLMRIDKIYYDFYQATRQQAGDRSVDLGHLLASEPTEIPSNILDGLGIFTVMAVDTMTWVAP